MKARWLFIAAAAALAAAALLPEEVSAIPVFARKYGFNCTMCHSNVPRLNDFGQLYRDNGYQLPGRENADRTVLESPTPLGFRTTAGYTGSTHDRAAGIADESAFQLNGLDLLSGGLLARNIGFFMVYTPTLVESRNVAGQEGNLEMANVMFSRLGSTWLNLRVGRFEPAYVPFSAKRQLSVSPYEMLDASFPGGPAFSETQTGLEVSGWGRTPFHYAAGVVTGSPTNRSYHSPADLYARAAWVVGPGGGQTAGHRVGVVGYLGSARPEIGTSRQSFYRFGPDVSLNVQHLNLAVQYLFASDDPMLWGEAATGNRVNWSGGFAELSYLPMVRLVGFARYDRVDAPAISNADLDRGTVGVRWYFVDNVAVHAEFSQRSVKSLLDPGTRLNDSFLTTRLDLAF